MNPDQDRLRRPADRRRLFRRRDHLHAHAPPGPAPSGLATPGPADVDPTRHDLLEEVPHDLLTLDPDLGDPATPATALGRERIERCRRDGVDVVVKRATGESRTTLQREAAVLEAIDDVATVTFVQHRRGERTDELCTADAGHALLSDPWSRSPTERAAAFADGCSALAGLHDRGWFHGAVTLDHLVVGGDGTTRWCSLGSAGRILDDADTRLDRVAITRAANRLARALPGARTLRRRLRRLGDEADPRRLARLFRRWSTHTRRAPSARVRRALDRVRELTLPTDRDEVRHHVRRMTPTWRPDTAVTGRARPVVVTGVLTGALVVALLGVAGRGCGSRPTATPAAAPATSTTTAPTTAAPATSADASTVPATTPATIPATIPATTTATVPATTTDTTNTTAPAASGPTVVVDGRPGTVGRPGDRALVTDTDCDGDQEVLVLRPTSGEVFDFGFDADGTAPGRRPGRIVHRDRTATDLVPAVPCGVASVRRADGTLAPIVTP